MFNDNANPLVTVIVITYNSAAYVLETLESAKQQSYKHIELIISDDKSTDETVSICQRWISENKSAFKNTKIISSEINTGIPANCNRAVKAAEGEWVKIIAGDDALYPQTIEKYIDFINEQNNSEISIIQSNIDVFTDNFNEKSYIKTDDLSALYQTKKQATASQQFEIMIRDPHLNTPSLIIKKNVYNKVGLYKEKFTLMEDFPWLLNALLMGVKIYYLNFSSVKYRKTISSVQTIKAKNVFVSNFTLQHDEFMYNEISKYYTKSERFFFLGIYNARKFLINKGLNIKNIKNRIIFVLLLSFPLFMFKFFLKRNLKKILINNTVL